MEGDRIILTEKKKKKRGLLCDSKGPIKIKNLKIKIIGKK